MNVNQHVCIVRPSSKVTPPFINALLSSQIGQKQIWRQQQGGGREGLNFSSLKNFIFPFPPKQDQIEIVTHIETQSAKIKTAITQANQSIEKLKEYKATLINSAVTGKINVSTHGY